ncbi:MAG: BcsR/BcsP family cellulose biosynthesis protein [Pseudomonadota bacterium]
MQTDIDQALAAMGVDHFTYVEFAAERRAAAAAARWPVLQQLVASNDAVAPASDDRAVEPAPRAVPQAAPAKTAGGDVLHALFTKPVQAAA